LRPGDELVIESSALKADVEDPDQSIGQLPEGLVVGFSSRPELVIVAPSPRGGSEGGEGPPVTGDGKVSVSGVAGQDDPTVTRRLGDW
jgi:hypothetical protein